LVPAGGVVAYFVFLGLWAAYTVVFGDDAWGQFALPWLLITAGAVVAAWRWRVARLFVAGVLATMSLFAVGSVVLWFVLREPTVDKKQLAIANRHLDVARRDPAFRQTPPGYHLVAETSQRDCAEGNDFAQPYRGRRLAADAPAGDLKAPFAAGFEQAGWELGYPSMQNAVPEWLKTFGTWNVSVQVRATGTTVDLRLFDDGPFSCPLTSD
jgi:hypothetical protein